MLQVLIASVLVFSSAAVFADEKERPSPTDVSNPRQGLKLADIPVHDPFIVPHKQSRTYYLYTSALPSDTGLDRCGVMTYKSKDLLGWGRALRRVSRA